MVRRLIVRNALSRLASSKDRHHSALTLIDRQSRSSHHQRSQFRFQTEEPVFQKLSNRRKPIPYPKQIHSFLDSYVIQQHAAKKTLSVGIYQHYKRLEHNDSVRIQKDILSATKPSAKGTKVVAALSNHTSVIENIADYIEELKNPSFMEKSNIVLLGPSGVGKTLLTQKLSSVLNVPFAYCDCTVLTQAGYVGDDVDTVLVKLLQNADYDVERATKGIIFLDEFDKIASSVDPIHSANGFRDVSGRGVQQALLKIVEGTVVKVKTGPQGQKIEIDTSDILFVASGAFSSLDHLVGRRLNKRSVGFGSSTTNHDEILSGKDEGMIAKKRDELLSQTEASDLITFGMIPELVGRFPVIVPFHSLNKEDLARILQEPRNSIISQAQKQFAIDNIKLTFTDDAIDAIAEEAVLRKTGARALRSIVERILLDAKYDCPGSNVGEVRIDGSTVRGTSLYSSIKKSPSDSTANELSN